MEKPTYYAPLLAVAARLESYGPLNSQLCELYCYAFFKQYTPAPHTVTTALAHLAEAQAWAQLLTEGSRLAPAAALVSRLAQSVRAGACALLAGAGFVGHASDETLRRETGRLVVKHALPTALSFYAAGPVGDFSVHRLPLATYKPGLHIGAAEIATDAALAEALRQTRYRRANAARREVQADPHKALRCKKTGAPLTKFKLEHWAQLTWRLGYTSFFDLVAQAQQAAEADASLAPAPAELLAAARTIATYCYAFFRAYLAGVAVTETSTEVALAA